MEDAYAAGNMTLLDSYIEMHYAMFSQFIANGLAVNVNFTNDYSWTTGNGASVSRNDNAVIGESGTTGPLFTVFKAVTTRMVQRLSSLPSSMVCFTTYNEMPGLADSLTIPKVNALWDSFRFVAPRHTLVVSPNRYGEIAVLDQLTPSRYDNNTMFDLHCYHPMPAVRQGEVGTLWEKISRLTYPPQNHVGGYNQALNDYEAALGHAAPSNMTGVFNIEGLNWFFGENSPVPPYTNRQDGPWLRDIMYQGYAPASYLGAANWRKARGLPADAILIGETGASGDWHDGSKQWLNLTATSQTNVLTDIAAAIKYHGFRVSYLAVDYVASPGAQGGFANGYGLFYSAAPFAAVNPAAIAGIMA